MTGTEAMNAAHAVEALAALAQDSRLAIFRQLVQDAPHGANPTDLALALGIAPALLSFHLKTLLHAGLVSSEHQGRSIRYRARIDQAQALVGYLLEHCCSGDVQQCAPPACAQPAQDSSSCPSLPKETAMHAPPHHVLFVCTGNSARSVLSEATLTALGGDRFVAYSAGSQPTGRVNPFALRQLEASGMPATGYRSKSWDEFSGPEAPPLDIVVTVCDSAAAESCPAFFGDFVTTHSGLADPAAVEGSDADKAAAFADAHRIIRHRIEQLVALPLESMRPAELRHRLALIGASLP